MSTLKKIKIWPFVALSHILTFDDLFWPRDQFSQKLPPRASFWRIICLLFMKFEIWPFFVFFLRFFDLWWPFWTLRLTFWKALAKSFILRYHLSTFEKDKNLTFLGLFSKIFDLWWPKLTLKLSFLKMLHSGLHFYV